MEYLHTMIRVTDLKATIAFFELMGFVETRRIENEKGRFTLVFLAAPDDAEQAKASRKPTVELTYNWDPEDYKGGRNFGHLAYAVDDIYATLRQAQGGRRDHQSPAARRPHGLHPHARQSSRSSSSRRASRSRPPSRGRRWRTSACGEASGAQAIAALTRLRNSSRKYARFSGVWTMRIANRESRGLTQNAVPIMPPQKNSPTLPAVGALPGSVRTAKPRPKPWPGQSREVVLPHACAEVIARHEGERPGTEDAPPSSEPPKLSMAAKRV